MVDSLLGQIHYQYHNSSMLMFVGYFLHRIYGFDGLGGLGGDELVVDEQPKWLCVFHAIGSSELGGKFKRAHDGRKK